MSGLKKSIKRQVKDDMTLNPVKKVKRRYETLKGKVGKVENYFAKPKFPEQVPAEMEDEYTTGRARNRDLIRRRRSGGRSSTIMSDTLG